MLICTQSFTAESQAFLLLNSINELESDIKSHSVSRDYALETLEELEMSSVYTGDYDDVQKLSYIRGLINTTRL